MPKVRSRASAVTEADIESFGNGAFPRTSEPTRAAVGRQVKEPKVSGINLRMTESQKALLQKAAAVEDISQQKVLDRLIWPLLQEKYGSD